MEKSHQKKFYVLAILVVYIIVCILVINSLHSKSWTAQVAVESYHDEIKPSLSASARLVSKDVETEKNVSDYEVVGEVQEVVVTSSQINNPQIDNSIVGLIMDEKELVEQQHGYREHLFNSLVSDRMGPGSRPIPDTRGKLCEQQQYDGTVFNQQKISLIISHHNELLSALLRTVNSVIDRTPPHMLHEIILVDDGSNNDIQPKLEEYFKNMTSLVKLLRLEANRGVGNARNFGFSEATGTILVFLDSHCEVNVGWIEPLVKEILKDEMVMVAPVLDEIQADTFEYLESQYIRYGFNWKMEITEELLAINQAMNGIDGYTTPVLPGNAFAMSHKTFSKLGGWDADMRGYGGESLEMSFRTWQCGGKLHIAPCSRVAHLRRTERPYGGMRESMAVEKLTQTNKMRLSWVWMDKYKAVIHWPHLDLHKRLGNFTERFQLKARLQCKTFTWYLDTIYPEVEIPRQRASHIRRAFHKYDSKTISLGRLAVSNIPICLMSYGDYSSSIVYADSCNVTNSHMKPTEKWWYTSNGEIRFGQSLCLSGIARLNSSPSLAKCDRKRGTQKWIFIDEEQKQESTKHSGYMYNTASGLCLAINSFLSDDKYRVLLRLCNNPTIQTFYFATLVS